MDQELVQYLDERFHYLDERFNRVDQRFDRVEQQLDAHDQRFDSIDQRFNRIEQRLDGHDQRFLSLDQRFEEVKRHTGVLVEGLRHELHLVAEGLTMHIEVRHREDRQYFDRKFEDTHALLRSFHQRPSPSAPPA